MKLIKDKKGNPKAITYEFKTYTLDTQYHDLKIKEGATCVDYVLKEDITKAVNAGWILLIKDLYSRLKKYKCPEREVKWWHDYWESYDRHTKLDSLPALKEVTMGLKGCSVQQNRHMLITNLTGLFDDAMSYAHSRGFKEGKASWKTKGR